MLHHKIFKTKELRLKIKKLMFRVNKEISIRILFSIFMDYKLNLKNPRTFNEKLQWIKLYYHDPLMKKCANKYQVREYIQKKGYGYTLNELYGVFEKVEDIDFDALPDSFVLKANHGCKMNIIVDDKKVLDIDDTRNTLDNWLAEDYYWRNLEWVYKDIEPKIICEKNLCDSNKEVPRDYKIFCFDGIPKIIGVDINRYTNHCVNLYDSNWQQIEGKLGYPLYNGDVEKPELLDEMPEMTRDLSAGFPHVRVDLYNYEGKIIFGELTFFSSAGFEFFEPYELNLTMGSWISIPKEKD